MNLIIIMHPCIIPTPSSQILSSRACCHQWWFMISSCFCLSQIWVHIVRIKQVWLYLLHLLGHEPCVLKPDFHGLLRPGCRNSPVWKIWAQPTCTVMFAELHLAGIVMINTQGTLILKKYLWWQNFRGNAIDASCSPKATTPAVSRRPLYKFHGWSRRCGPKLSAQPWPCWFHARIGSGPYDDQCCENWCYQPSHRADGPGHRRYIHSSHGPATAGTHLQSTH